MTPRRSAPLIFSICLLSVATTGVTACSVYRSSDRKAFDNGGAAAAAAANKIVKKQSGTCSTVQDTSSLLLHGLDVIHETEAWHVIEGERPGSYSFLWAKRLFENGSGFEAVYCKFELANQSELTQNISSLPSSAASLADELTPREP